MAETYSDNYEPHRFTIAELDRLWDEGFFPEHPHLELLDGEIYHVPTDGPIHISWNAAVAEWLYRALLDTQLRIIPDKTLRLPPFDAPKPDFWVVPRSVKTAEIKGSDVLLVIEEADTSLARDTIKKPPRYAEHGVREYWVIDCKTDRLFVYVLGDDGTYGDPLIFSNSEPVTARHVDGLTLRIADLDIGA